MGKDIIIRDGEYKFNFRVAAVFINDGKILLQTAGINSYYFLPGGRVQHYESTIQALQRELKEELNIAILPTEMKLIDVLENFYIHNGAKVHELLFIYRVNNEKVCKYDEIKVADKDDAINRWYLIDSLRNIDFKPMLDIDTLSTEKILHEIIKEY